MKIQTLFRHLLDWIYPPACVNCGKPGSLICGECLGKLQPVGDHYCLKCGKPLKKGRSCRLCSTSDFRFQSSRSPYVYDGPAAAMIKSLKYNGMLDLAPILADHLAEFWKSAGTDVDMVIPVPLSEKRQAERGFNQSALIAKAFSKKTGIPFRSDVLKKTVHTPTQVGLNADQRRENLSGVFAAEDMFVKGQRILLIDDVMTTGSTFAECSAVLLDAGAKTVNCLSAATASAEPGNQKMLNTL